MGSLKLINKNNKVTELTVSALFRICCLFFFAAILTGSIVSRRFDVIPSLVALTALAGGLYREKWTFDIENREIRSVFGVGPFVKKETIPFSVVERFEITHFVKGQSDIAVTKPKSYRRGRKPYLTFSIVLKPSDPETGTPEKRDIEIIPESVSGGRTETNARALSTFCSIDLLIDG